MILLESASLHRCQILHVLEKCIYGNGEIQRLPIRDVEDQVWTPIMFRVMLVEDLSRG